MVYPPTRAEACLVSYLSFSSANSGRHATALSHTPCDLSQRADSNGVLPNPSRHLPGELSLFFICQELQTSKCFGRYTIRFASARGFKWATSGLNPTAGCRAGFHSECTLVLPPPQIQRSWRLQSSHHFEPYTIRSVFVSGFQWCTSRPEWTPAW